MTRRRQIKVEDWKDLSTDDAYKLSISEFKGATMQALQDIKDDIKDLQQDAKVRSWITFGIGGIAGLIASVVTNLGLKH